MTNVLVTGAASGFGRLITTTLLAAGHQVAATVLDSHGRRSAAAERLRAEGAEVVDMDVTDDDSVRAGVATAVERLGRLDVVVNNAGRGALGLAESFSAEDWKRIFDVNVFGVQRVSQAVIPHFRERHTGLLLLISSMTAQLPVPFQGPYGASKAAAEALSEFYRLELPQFGIESAVIEPNGFRTEFLDKNLMTDVEAWRPVYGDFAAMPAQALAAYNEQFDAIAEHDPQLVADAVRDLVAMPHGTRPFRTTVDRMGLGAVTDRVNSFREQIRADLWSQMGLADLAVVRAV
ncbi:SDR family NAD(P)-dependent oxidoreductase [Actinoplanes rectilineatus]|uniref:SDR family NAD(P)-dependent oxidoreductase n=1 Tax=Actinoplanes rectilineatus TaxID=113571 RepID=UPI0005F297BA|nr:SDR family NAD(P)-dependent oxidoreductase [Actinoplanes rectilineatus]